MRGAPVDLRDLLGLRDTRPAPEIRDPNPLVEEQLRQMDERINRPIVALDGTPLLRPLVDDRYITYAKDGESASIDPIDTLMRAARMLRDGWSLANIRAELDLIPEGPERPSDALLESAIVNIGMVLLDKAIAEGREPAESVRVVGYMPVEEPEDDAQVVADAEGEVETRTVQMTPAMSRKIMRALHKGRTKPRRR